ncbi:hypothetical protein Tco_0893730 [Tanacetum coccineum]|uniref:No apical meristem-associated C-terminal domain-containing protein n=1 Tax=Tanacetum coccineum TaxID=301880 RepID=A0ABQ5CCH9_9ASTR
MKRARTTYRDENKGTPFSQEDTWEILRTHAKWDAPSSVEPFDLTGGEQVPGVSHEELFGEDARPRPPGCGKARPDVVESAYELAKEKDRTLIGTEKTKTQEKRSQPDKHRDTERIENNRTGRMLSKIDNSSDKGHLDRVIRLEMLSLVETPQGECHADEENTLRARFLY